MDMGLPEYRIQTNLDTTLGHHNITACEQGAPESKCAICVDRVVAGGQNTEIKPHQVILGHFLCTEVCSKPHIRVVVQVGLEQSCDSIIL